MQSRVSARDAHSCASPKSRRWPGSSGSSAARVCKKSSEGLFTRISLYSPQPELRDIDDALCDHEQPGNPLSCADLLRNVRYEAHPWARIRSAHHVGRATDRAGAPASVRHGTSRWCVSMKEFDLRRNASCGRSAALVRLTVCVQKRKPNSNMHRSTFVRGSLANSSSGASSMSSC